MVKAVRAIIINWKGLCTITVEIRFSDRKGTELFSGLENLDFSILNFDLLNVQ